MARRPPSSESGSLFEAAPAAQDSTPAKAPLAARMRPRNLEEYVGQEEILGPGRLLRKILDEAASHGDKPLPSMIFWGPPGTGKTTLAYLVSQAADAEFVMFSAVSSGIREAREVIEGARDHLRRDGRRTVLFVDEIHRFNKAQQDAFLPAIEDGIISLLGATTENPSFEINNALLSRSRVFTLKALDASQIETLLRRALTDNERGLGRLPRRGPAKKTALTKASA